MSMLFLNDGDAAGRVGDVAGAETERGALNDSFRGGRGGTLVDDMLWGVGGPSKLIRGAVSCGSGLIAWRGE
jgi:hypothetical protein